MFCQKCGKEISDTVKFCAFCGAPVEVEQIPVMPVVPLGAPNSNANPAASKGKANEDVPVDDDKTVVLTNSQKGKKGPQNGNGNATQQPPVIPVVPVQAPGGPNMPGEPDMSGAPNMPGGAYGQGAAVPPAKEKKSHIGIWVLIGLIGIVAAVLIVLLAKGMFGGLFGESSKEISKVAYLKDDELSAVLNIKASEPDSVEVVETKNASGSDSYGLARFSEDGSYLYYFSKIDDGNDMGTLCRVPTAKLKSDESKNADLEEEIDKKVYRYQYNIIGNTSVLYMKGDKLLFYVDGEEQELEDSLAEDSYYRLTEDNKYVVYRDEDQTLYIQELVKNSEPREIDSDVDIVEHVFDTGLVVYGKDYDKDAGMGELYVGGIDKKAEQISEDVAYSCGFSSDELSFYYMVEKEEENSLANYVNDPYAEKDGDAKEPEYIDYFATEKNYPELSEDDEGEYTQEEFMRMIPYDSIFDMDYYYNGDNDKVYYYNEDNEKWYTDFDEDGYAQASEEYEAAGRRKELRDEIKSAKPVSDSYYELYYYADGKSSQICESIKKDFVSGYQGVVYSKKEAGEAGETYDINEIDSADDLRERIQSGSDDEAAEDSDNEPGEHAYFCSIGGSDGKEVEEFDEIEGLYVSQNCQKAVIEGDFEDGMGELIAYNVSGSGLGKGETISKEGDMKTTKDNIFYYHENKDENEADVYSYDGSKTKLLAKGVYTYDQFITDEGEMIGYVDWDDEEGDLSVFGRDGKGERVAKNVQDYRYLGSGAYLLMKDGDLYYLNKAGEETRLAKDVEAFWYPGKLPGFYM